MIRLVNRHVSYNSQASLADDFINDRAELFNAWMEAGEDCVAPLSANRLESVAR